jgi:hypothetical protein
MRAGEELREREPDGATKTMAFPSGARQTRNHCIAALELADKCTTNAPEPALPLLYCARVRASSRSSEGENRIQKAKVEEKKSIQRKNKKAKVEKIREDDP